jgi:glyoxylase-like metal-dependent hydrolase (beta-lactamase superfamily II)
MKGHIRTAADSPLHSRRSFLHQASSCSAYLLAAFAAGPTLLRRAFASSQKFDVVASEAFGRLEQVADGVWALISTPQSGRETLSNGGIVAGRDGVLVIEAQYTDEGADWLIAAAEELTGRPPTHLLLTHYHADHSWGMSAYERLKAPPVLYTTHKTRDLLTASLEEGEREMPGAEMFASAIMISAAGSQETVDLGGRMVHIDSRAGHTPSDLSIEVADPRVVFCGDLVWNGMFPNYMDAIPSRLTRQCRAMLRDPQAVYVPGHGGLATSEELEPYVALLEEIGRAARDAFEKGIPASEAAAEYTLPASLGEWTMFSPSYYQVAFEAWERELSGNSPAA